MQALVVIITMVIIKLKMGWVSAHKMLMIQLMGKMAGM